MEVPLDFKDAFEKDPDEACANFVESGGVSVLSIRPFIGRRDLITEMMRRGTEMGLKHPFSELSVSRCNTNTNTVDPREPALDRQKLIHKLNGRSPHCDWAVLRAYRPREKRRRLLDLGIAHVTGSRQVSRGFGREKKFETRPIIRIDLSLQIVAPPRGEIRISAVREVLYAAEVARDGTRHRQLRQLGSEESIQTLKGEGFNAEKLSVDTDGAP